MAVTKSAWATARVKSEIDADGDGLNSLRALRDHYLEKAIDPCMPEAKGYYYGAAVAVSTLIGDEVDKSELIASDIAHRVEETLGV
jgi:hypothetical protein